jgi:D-alanyl-D-alanine carboxypeptidase
MVISRKPTVPDSSSLFRRVGAILLIFSIVLFSAAVSAQARTRGVLIMDADTGQIIHESNSDVPNHPASLTKIMTLYLLFDALEAGRVHLHDPMTVSMHAARQAPSKLGLIPGQTVRVDQAILALVTKSANDVAVVVAEHLGGTETAFAATMTKKAQSLGMRRTMFRNASGLPIAGQWSTPRDMAILARALIKNHAQEYHYFSTREFEYDGQVIATHNHLLGNYPGADGIKTGYIASSGFNLVASAKRDGHRIIGVVFGGNSVRDRDRQMVALLDAGFAHEAGAPQAAIAKADQAAEPPAADEAPTTEAEAEDPDVAAVMRSMAAAGPVAEQSASAASQPVVGAGDAEDPPWGIRLGSFGQRAKAEKVASATAKRLGDLVADGHTQVVPTRVRHAVVYRAELVGLAEADAQRACVALRHHRAPCAVIKADPAG